LRTAEAILAKNEQISDALEHGRISPKTSEQLSQCLKMPIELAKLEMKMHDMLRKHGRTTPVPRSPLVRSMIGGLNPDKVEPSDGENVRALIGDPEKK
jgi:hypothetical protein